MVGWIFAQYDLAGRWPAAVPIARSVGVGYRTGTSLLETRVTAAATETYSLISSGEQLTDSDGGELDAADLDDLRISVFRRTGGPMQLRVTEAYAEVELVPVD